MTRTFRYNPDSKTMVEQERMGKPQHHQFTDFTGDAQAADRNADDWYRYNKHIADRASYPIAKGTEGKWDADKDYPEGSFVIQGTGNFMDNLAYAYPLPTVQAENKVSESDAKECNGHRAIIDTGTGHYYCPECKGSWTPEEWKKGLPHLRNCAAALEPMIPLSEVLKIAEEAWEAGINWHDCNSFGRIPNPNPDKTQYLSQLAERLGKK